MIKSEVKLRAWLTLFKHFCFSYVIFLCDDEDDWVPCFACLRRDFNVCYLYSLAGIYSVPFIYFHGYRSYPWVSQKHYQNVNCDLFCFWLKWNFSLRKVKCINHTHLQKGQNGPRKDIKLNTHDFIFIWPIFFQLGACSRLTVPFNSNEVVANSHSRGRLNPRDCTVKVRILPADFTVLKLLFL